MTEEEDNAQENQTQNVAQPESTISETEQLQKVPEPVAVQGLTEEQEDVADADEVEDDVEGDNKEGIEEYDEEGEEIMEEEELSATELEALFNKNTSSFRCLAQILLSRSSLLRHPLYNFPPLEDPGIDAAFNYVEPEEPIDNVCIESYKKLCKEMNIVPISRVIKSLPTKVLNLRYYSLTTKEFKTVALALKLNTFVEELNLEENFLYPDSAYYVEELLRENNTLKVLNMRECRIGPEGAEILSEGIMLTQSLNELDLSYNDLETEGLKSLVSALKENTTIKRLNLSHNNFSLDAAYHMASILRENLVLEDLDLSWNNFGTPQAMKVLFNDGITVNCLLRSLNLAWNGISLKTAIKPMRKFIKKSEMLEILDLSNNRIGGVTLNIIKNAIKQSPSIRALNLAYNVLTPENAQAVADVLVSTKDAPNLQLLDMENVFVKKGFIPTLKKANKLGKIIKVTGILGNWKIKGPNVSKLLFDRARLLAMKPKRKKKKKDFSHFVLGLPDKPMKKTAFDTLAKKFKMKMVDNDLLAEIIKQFPYKKKGIDCVAMKEKYKELFPDAEPAPVKKTKKKGKGKRKKGGDCSVTKVTGSEFNTSTIGGSTVLSFAVPEKKKASFSDATPSVDKSEGSQLQLETKQSSFEKSSDQIEHPPDGKRISLDDAKEQSSVAPSDGNRSSVTFSDERDYTDDRDKGTLLETGGDISQGIDSQHVDGTTLSEQIGKYTQNSQESVRASIHSAAFSVVMEEEPVKSNQIETTEPVLEEN